MDSSDSSASSLFMTTLMPKYQEHTFIEFKVANAIITYLFPILIIVGTVSNIISLIILRCKSFKSSSVSFSLSVLSAVNLCILYVGVLRIWVLEITDRAVDFRVTSFGCKVHIMMTYLLCHMTSWTLVLIVVERTIIICFPIAARPYCTRKTTITVWCVTTGVLVLINMHFLFTFGYIPDPLEFSYFEIKPTNEPELHIGMIKSKGFNSTEATATIQGMISNNTGKMYKYVCYAHREYFNFYHNIWPWIDGLILSIIPFLILLAGNLAIVITISRAVKFRIGSTSSYSSSTAVKMNSVFSETPQNSCCGNIDKKVFRSQRALKGSKTKTMSCGSDANNPSSSTYMLLGSSFIFLFLTTPSGIYLLLSDMLFAYDASPANVAKYRLSFAVTFFLYYLNNSINFIIYYLTGSRFRKSFKDYFSSRDTLNSEGRLSDGANFSTVLKTKIKALNLEFRQIV